MTDRDLAQLFSQLEQPVVPDQAFVDDLLQRVETQLTGDRAAAPTSDSHLIDLKELDMPQLVESPTKRRWLLPVVGLAAAVLAVVAIAVTRSSDDKHVTSVAPPTTINPISGYAAQLDDAYSSYYSALNQYFNACQLAINDTDFTGCERTIDAAIAAVNTFDDTMSKVQPPAAVADDQRQILAGSPAILDILQRSKAAAAAGDRATLRDINPTFGAAYQATCAATKHFNSLAPNDHHIRRDLGPGCSDQ